MPRRLLLWAVTALSGLAVLAALALPFVAARSVIAKVGHDDRSATAELPLAGHLQSGVRTLPLALAGGVIDKKFSGGAGLSDAAKTEAALIDLGPRIGLDADTLTAMLHTWPTYGHGYPYTYDPYDRFVVSNLAVSPTGADYRSVIDFSTLAIALAQSDDLSWAPALAYSVLRRTAAIEDTCDVQTQIVFLVISGIQPAYADVEHEVRRAEALCPGDPTPRWLLAKFAATQASITDEIRTLDGTAEHRRWLAERAFADLRDRYPASPTGWAGAADLYLSWADSAETYNGEPFQVRRWRTQAVDLYRSARQRFSDPRLAVGEARALSTLGQHPQAVQLVNEANPLLPHDLATAVVRADVLSRSGAHSSAADAISDERVTPAWWLKARPGFRPDFVNGAYGAQELPALVLNDATYHQFGAGGVNDLSFIPRHRDPLIASYCRSGKRMEELLLAHRGDEVTSLLAQGGSLTRVTPDLDCDLPEMTEVAYLSTADMAALATLDQGDDTAVDPRLRDRWQDLLRSAEQWDRARAADEDWTTAEPTSGTAWQRLGEVAFFMQDPGAAALCFEKAAALFGGAARDAAANTDGLDPAQHEAWAQLQRGAVSDQSGHSEDANTWYQAALTTVAPSPADDYYWTDYLRVHARGQLGRRALLDGHYADAAALLEKAVATGRRHDEVISAEGASVEPNATGPLSTGNLGQNNMLHGADESNLALSYARLGHGPEAVSLARDAQSRDPGSPIFTDTLAFALQAHGDNASAISVFRVALEQDETSYASANNLAVLLEQQGQTASARSVLEDVLTAAPAYALGWHNLGVLDQGTWSLTSYLRSQGELGRAARLSPTLRTADLELSPDNVVYDTAFDVSKPVPVGWTYGQAATVPATHWTAAFVGLLAIRLLMLVINEIVGGRFAEWLLGHSPGRSRWLRAPLTALVAVVVTVVVLVGRQAILRPSIATIVLAVTIAAMVTVAVALRALLEPNARQSTTSGVLAAAAVAGALGYPFAPFPSLNTSTSGPLGRFSIWVAPSTATFVLLVATVSLSFTGVPAARSLALGTATLLGSIFIAVPPMDGHQIHGRKTNVLISGGLLLVAAVYGLALV